jgi:hypothetical protein
MDLPGSARMIRSWYREVMPTSNVHVGQLNLRDYDLEPRISLVCLVHIVNTDEDAYATR